MPSLQSSSTTDSPSPNPLLFLRMPSFQSSPGTVTPDPELFFGDDDDISMMIFDDDLCFETPCDLDTTSAQRVPDNLTTGDTDASQGKKEMNELV